MGSFKKDFSFKRILRGKGHLGRILNPGVAIYYQGGRKVINGLRRRTWKKKLLPGSASSAMSYDSILSGSPYGATGSIVGRY